MNWEFIRDTIIPLLVTIFGVVAAFFKALEALQKWWKARNNGDKQSTEQMLKLIEQQSLTLELLTQRVEQLARETDEMPAVQIDQP